MSSEPKKTKAKKLSKSELALKTQLDETTADMQRIQADFVNFKRQIDSDVERIRELTKRQTVAVMLATVDNIERATANRPKELVGNAWAEGVTRVAKQMLEDLAAIGVEKIPAQGQDFDPELMQAVSVADDKGEREIVVEVLQPGYTLNGEVIRHAMVSVGKE